MQKAFDFLATVIPGWTPSESQLDTWVIEAVGNQGADIATLTTEVPKSIYRYFGATLFRVPPLDATAATAASTWFLSDSLGHLIPAGTQVAINDGAGTPQLFTVLTDVIVPGGSSETGVGQVVLIASNPGSASSDIGSVDGIVTLQDTFAWVDHITQTTITTGGQDAETDDDYLDRLTSELQTMSPRPILPVDFSILARNVTGVQRAAAIDGYNPGDMTFGNERMIAIAAVDSAGVAVSSGVKTAIESYLESMREVNFVVNTLDPDSVAIDVTIHFTTLVGYSISDVETRVTTAIQTFLDPAMWGITGNDNPNDPRTWNNTTLIRYLDLANVIKNVSGVDVINLLELGLHGGSLLSTDLDLSGIVPLPALTTLSVVGI